jgi:AcrR family transcriptional regulator
VLKTPWGDADALRDRPLPGGRGSDRAAVRREQSERFMAAVVASCVERGYEATSVEDLVRISGSSRTTFYEHFDDKLDCFRTAERAIIAWAISLTAARLDGEGDAMQRARSALEAFVELVVAQPAAARMCLVDAYAAGETAIDPVHGAIDRITLLARDVVEQIHGTDSVSLELVRGIVGGFHQVIYGRLLSRREAELPGLVPGLWDWAMSFTPPPAPLRRAGRLVVSRPISAAPPFASYSVEQRIIRALAATVAEQGYPATTVADVVAAASVSQTTFYEYFDGKEDALIAALESSGGQLLGAVLPTLRRIEDWRIAMRVGFEEICGFLAAEPAFASMRCVDAYAAGPEAIAARERTGVQILSELGPAALAEAGTGISTLDNEASSGAIYAILFEGVRGGRSAELPRLAPYLTYFALVPFIGAAEAAEVATGRGRGRTG